MTTTILGVEPQNAWFMVMAITIMAIEAIWIWHDYVYGEYAEIRSKRKKLEESSKQWRKAWNL